MNAPATQDSVEMLEGHLLEQPQVDCPVMHRFAPGVYMREIFMPAGSLIIGHRHKTKHFNVVMQGKAWVSQNGKVDLVYAPDTFVSEPGVRKCLLILEDMIWQTVHPIAEQNAGEMSDDEKLALIESLEPQMIEKSETWLEHEQRTINAEVAKLMEVAQ